MSGEMLVHKSEVDLNGDRYEILVFCREDGRYLPDQFRRNDVIIHDGPSLEDVLAKHEKVLALAITSRHVQHMVKSGIAHHRSEPS
jgi:hypothetical protein